MARTPRRALLVGGAALAGTAVAPGLQAASAATYSVNPYRRTTAPSATQRHLMNRMGCGWSRSTFARMRAAGSAGAWFEDQLRPGSVKESAKAGELAGWFPDLWESPRTKWERNRSGSKGGWEYAADLASWSMLRRVYSERQVLETMVEVWSDHLHVHANGDLAWVQRAGYDATIRKHALGTFEDLLVACTLHPAMLLYLDNWRSVKGAPNENHGRELLELHTVGRVSGYTEQMVKDSARILSGFTVDAFGSWDGFYDPARHTTGAVQVLGFTHANASADGQEMTRAYLRYLARHPATAHNVARRLARKFVADEPSTTLVNDLAKVFRDSGTDIRATLRALVAHPEFKASKGLLVRTPIEDFVATCRALRVNVQAPTGSKSFARAAVWVPQTTLAYHWPRPDGPPYGDAAWASATRMLSSFRMHWNLTAGWWPTEDVRYRKPASWLPERSIRLDRYVDHLSRMMLGRPSDSRMLTAAVTAVGLPPATKVTKDHAISGWLFVRLVGVLLDSPDHMRR
jgi:hypothetical protein